MAEWFDEETDEPLIADHRNFYKVELWTKDEQRIERMVFADSSLDKARAYRRFRPEAPTGAADDQAANSTCFNGGQSGRSGDSARDKTRLPAVLDPFRRFKF